MSKSAVLTGTLFAPASVRVAARFGCNEPGPSPERYLDRGTPGSLLMAFPGTGNKGVTSTTRAGRSAQRAEDRHAAVNSRRSVFCSGPLDLRAQARVRRALRADTPKHFRAARSSTPWLLVHPA